MKIKPFFLILSLALGLCPVASALQPGDLAPPFSLRDSQGKNFFLSAHLGKQQKGHSKGLILNFFASSCRPCRRELPVLNALVDEFKPQGIQVAIIGYREDFDQFTDLLAELGVESPTILSDKYGKVGERYGVRFLPTTFFISSDGRVKDILRGELPNIEQALRQRAAELSK